MRIEVEREVQQPAGPLARQVEGGPQRGLLAVLTGQTPLRVRTEQPAAAAVVGTIEYGPYLVPDERKPYAASGSTRAPPGWSASPAKRTGFC